MPTEEVKATIIGFTRPNCKKCYGRGYTGFDMKYKGDNGQRTHVVPCSCCEFFQVEQVQKAWKAAQGDTVRGGGDAAEQEQNKAGRPEAARESPPLSDNDESEPPRENFDAGVCIK